MNYKANLLLIFMLQGPYTNPDIPVVKIQNDARTRYPNIQHILSASDAAAVYATIDAADALEKMGAGLTPPLQPNGRYVDQNCGPPELIPLAPTPDKTISPEVEPEDDLEALEDKAIQAEKNALAAEAREHFGKSSKKLSDEIYRYQVWLSYNPYKTSGGQTGPED